MRSRYASAAFALPATLAVGAASALLLVGVVSCAVPAFRGFAGLKSESTAPSWQSTATAPSSSATTGPLEATPSVAASAAPASPTPAPVPEPPPPTPAKPFEVSSALDYIRHLSNEIGVRRGGTAAEARAATYLLDALRSLGYSDTQIRDVPLPNGRTSHVVWATKQGTSPDDIVLGAHMDTKSPSPGANDNGSGCGVVLELARDLKDATITPTVTFVFFGTEEMIDHDQDHHHYGSRWFVEHMPADLRRDVAGMISLDMVGYGGALAVRTMGRGPKGMANLLKDRFRAAGVQTIYVRDPGRYGWSDHEPFELAGIPAAWLEWRGTGGQGSSQLLRDDPVYHTSGDRFSHVRANPIERTGTTMRAFLLGLGAADLAALKAPRR